MRVLHVISALDEGGPEHQLRLLIARLPHESEVVTLSPPGAVADALRAAGIRVHELHTGDTRGREVYAGDTRVHEPGAGGTRVQQLHSGDTHGHQLGAGDTRMQQLHSDGTRGHELSARGTHGHDLGAGGTHRHEILGDGGPLRRLLRRRFGLLYDLIYVVGPLRRLIRRGHFDLVHAHTHRACTPGRVAARLAGVRRVVATEAGGEGGRLHRAAERLGSITIAGTSACAERLRDRGVPDARIIRIPKALDPAEFRFDPAVRATARRRLGIPPGAAVVGGIGRLEPAERFDRLIRAVGEVPGATLLLVGDGPARDALEKLAAIEGIADRVVFAGPVAHAREVLCAMDVFASPSEETFGLAVLEALAAGLPALYARCEPLPELRHEPEGVKRLTPHDRESLPRALRAELLCVAERHGARLPARTASPRYDADHMADAVDRVYAGIGNQ